MYIASSESFLQKGVFVSLSNKDSDMHAHAHSWSINHGDSNQHKNQLLSLFLIMHMFYIAKQTQSPV